MEHLMNAKSGLDERTLRQSQIANALLRRKKGTLEAATGFGKTRTALIALERLSLEKPIDVMVIVPKIDLKTQWEKQLKNLPLRSFEVIVVNTARDMEQTYSDVLILDEVHNFVSEMNSKIFELHKSEYLWCLSATIFRDDGKHELILQYAPMVDRVTIEEAKTREFVNPYEIYLLKLPLLNYERKYREIEDEFNLKFEKFGKNFKYLMAVLKQRSLQIQLADALEISHGEVMKLAIRTIKLIQGRKTFVNHCPAKTKAILEILNKFPDEKYILFGTDIEMAEKVQRAIGEECGLYHSKQPAKERREELGKFIAGKYRGMSTARSLDEGSDISNVSLGIVYGSSSVTRQHLQRLGRIIRKEEGKQARMINICMKQTVDERWSRTRLRGQRYHKVESVKEIR